MRNRDENLPNTTSGPVVIGKSVFYVHIAHWTVMLLAVPVFFFWANRDVFGGYLLVSFLSFALLVSLLPRSLWEKSRSSGFFVHPRLRSFALAVGGIGVAAVLISALCMFLLREGGPSVHEGVYCLWNHRFIREISYEEFLRLSRIERMLFCCGWAGIRSGFLWMLCCVDEIQ